MRLICARVDDPQQRPAGPGTLVTFCDACREPVNIRVETIAAAKQFPEASGVEILCIPCAVKLPGPKVWYRVPYQEFRPNAADPT